METMVLKITETMVVEITETSGVKTTGIRNLDGPQGRETEVVGLLLSRPSRDVLSPPRRPGFRVRETRVLGDRTERGLPPGRHEKRRPA